MPEINSRQAAKIAANTKLANHEAGQRRTVVIQTPAAFASLAVNDTIAGGQFVPAASRLLGARVSNATGNASSAIDIGLRKRKDGTVLNAAAIASNVAIATATTNPTEGSNGVYLAGGVDAPLADDAEIYLTVKGAALLGNQAVRVEVDYVGA